jgi:hypothetical protein
MMPADALGQGPDYLHRDAAVSPEQLVDRGLPSIKVISPSKKIAFPGAKLSVLPCSIGQV